MKEFYLKGTLVSALVLIGFCSCNQVLVKQIGKINMISTRNVEFEHDYVLISSYAGGAQKELKKSTALSIGGCLG
jgi:hypothetical protein